MRNPPIVCINYSEETNNLQTGCQWRLLPADFPPMRFVRYYFDQWNTDGTVVKISDSLRKMARKAMGREEEPSICVIDSQSVKTTACGGERGIDGGKRYTAGSGSV